ncbi:guanine nucleotide-binding protein subunit alpha [Balamuthia mandrillaris]
MGACASQPTTPEQKVAAQNSKKIDQDIQKDKKKNAREVKLLLLGTGASGKSTVAKQMQIIYLNGFAEEEKKDYKRLCQLNIAVNMQALLGGMKKLSISLADSSLSSEADVISFIDVNDENFELSKASLDSIKRLWEDDGVQTAYKRSNEFSCSDNIDYFFTDMDRFLKSDYVVSTEDILRARKKTTGVLEIFFSNGDLDFRLVDVGGQRNERRKWIHCFEDVTAIIYVAALSEYDQVLEEEESVNRMQESLELFEDTINNAWFQETPIILFLNKKDIFEEKLAEKDPADYINGYNAGKDLDRALKFFRKLYTDKNKSKGRDIYVHETTATDTQNIITVFNAVQDIFVKEAIDQTGF